MQTSRSVIIPTGRCSRSTTETTPQSCSHIRRAASLVELSARQVTTSRLIRSLTRMVPPFSLIALGARLGGSATAARARSSLRERGYEGSSRLALSGVRSGGGEDCARGCCWRWDSWAVWRGASGPRTQSAHRFRPPRRTHSALRAGRNHPPTHSALRAGPRDRQGSEYRALPVTRLIKTGGEPEPWSLSPSRCGASSRADLHEARVRLQLLPLSPPPPF